jgi:hypothetical protein
MGSPFASARTWHDASNKFSIVGEFVEVKDGKVRIHKEDGGYVNIDVTKLSKPDLKYLEKQNVDLTGEDNSGSKEDSKGESKDDPKSRAKEAFIRSLKDAITKKNPAQLKKLIYEANKCPPMILMAWGSQLAAQGNKKFKSATITDDTEGMPGMDFPLDVAGKLEIVFDEGGKENKLPAVPLGFKGGSYYFMIPKQLLENANNLPAKLKK